MGEWWGHIEDTIWDGDVIVAILRNIQCTRLLRKIGFIIKTQQTRIRKTLEWMLGRTSMAGLWPPAYLLGTLSASCFPWSSSISFGLCSPPNPPPTSTLYMTYHGLCSLPQASSKCLSSDSWERLWLHSHFGPIRGRDLERLEVKGQRM